jgi:transcriptional regulator with XRE-family HTH domain
VTGSTHNQSSDGPEETQGSTADVGSRLRALREARGLTIRALASRSGLAINTLSLIEHGRTSPSVSTLQQLARALETPITAFFATDTPRRQVVFSSAGRRAAATFAHGTLEDLGAGIADRTVEPLLVVLQPHAGSGPDPIVHTGQEFVYCLEGRVVYTVADATYELSPGDSLLFEAHLPHCWHNPDGATARALLVLCPSDRRDRPAERHFAPA